MSVKYYKNGWKDPTEEVYKVYEDGTFEYRWISKEDCEYDTEWQPADDEGDFKHVMEAYAVIEITEAELFVLCI